MRAGDPIGVEDHATIDIARGAADRLDQRGFGAQESFLVGIEDRDQPAFGNVEPLAQQVDPDQHVVDPQAQIADQLDALQRLDVGVHVADLDARLVHELGQILRHPLGQRGDERSVACLRGLAAFLDAILHLVLDRADLDRRVDQPGGADHLLGEDAAGPLHLPRAGRGRDAKGLRAHRVPFVEAERAVVDAARQAEAVFGQRDLAAVVPARHRADLRHGLVALVDEQQRVFGQVLEQGGRRFAGQAAGEKSASNSRSRCSCRWRRSFRDRNWSAAPAVALRAGGLPRAAPSAAPPARSGSPARPASSSGRE